MRVHLCVWFVAVCATVSVSDGVHGFIGHSVVFFFFLTIKYLFYCYFLCRFTLFVVGSGERHKAPETLSS